jgi:hypothetical protein
VFTKIPFRQAEPLPGGTDALILRQWEPAARIAPKPHKRKAAEKLKDFLDTVCLFLFLAAVAMLLVLAVLPADWF